MKKRNRWEKIFRVMKCTIFLMLFFIVGLKANVYSQHDLVSLQMKDASLVNVFDKLEGITGVKFLYNVELVKGKGNVDVDVNKMPFREVLTEVLKERGLSFTFSDDQVVIKKAAPESAVPQKTSYQVKGKVCDMKGETLPGATLCLEGTTVGMATDADGTFIINLPVEKGVLVFSFIGYKEKKCNFQAGKFLEVKLEDATSNLDEVTVIAYGQRKKRELISSISSVKADEIKELPTPSLETLLQGRMAGLGVVQQSGAPGSGGNSVAIRGYNSLLDDEAGYKSDGSPLYVIDGVPVHSFTSPVTGTNTISEIDPSTIESVEVLKDAASAAIYGSRAANGVILITTKKGRAGRGKFSANFSYTGSILPKAPTQIGGKGERLFYLAMMKATKQAYYDKVTGEWKYPTSMEEAAKNGVNYNLLWNMGLGASSSSGMLKVLQDSLNPFFNNSTNWYKYVFRPGKILNGNIQTSGGSETIQYLIGAGIYKEVGIMPGSDFLRGNLLTNLSVQPVKNLTIDSRIYLAYTDRSRGPGAGGGRYESFSIDPTITSSLLNAGGSVEEKLLQRLNGQKETNTSYRLRGNLVLAYQIINGLSISTSLALDYNQMNQNKFVPSYLDPTYRETKSSGEIVRDMLLTNENLISYAFSIKDKHNFDVLLGLAFDGSKTWSNSGFGLGGPSDMIEYVGSGFPDLDYSAVSGEYRALQRYISDFSETMMTSYFGRLAYNYDKKYLLEVTLRRDGSSVFGANSRWATFPSVALGWAFSEEPFMRWAWWMNFGKFRASWGRAGSQFGIPYLAQGLMEPGVKFDGVQGMRPSGVVNRKLKWEESDQYDIGLDMDLFDYRLGLVMDYYYKYTNSLIYKVPMPGDMYGENGVQWQNAMAVSNEGLELEAKIDILRNTAVKWRARFNISKNWNRFEKSYSGTDIPGMVIGKSLSGIYLFKDNGLIQYADGVPYVYDENGKKLVLAPEGDQQMFFTQGMRWIADLDGDGQITEDDMYYAGSALPKAYGGFANELRWKNFDLNFLFTFTLGRNMVNAFRQETVGITNSGSLKPIFGNISSSDFWQKPGDQTPYPTLGIYPSGSLQYSGLLSSHLEKVHYCKLKQLTLGYNLPDNVMKKMHMEGIRFFVTGENLFTLTNYSGLDPEVVNMHSGIDQGSEYPLARKWTIGLTLNF